MYILLILISCINIIISQEINLNIIDNSFGEKIEVDSIKLYNENLDIDTTLTYSDIIDLTALLVASSVEEKSNISISFINSALTINSKEIINKVEIYNLLGEKIETFFPNSYTFNSHLNSNSNLLFIQIITNNNKIINKLLNNKENLISNENLINRYSPDNWYLTFYKKGFKTKTLVYKSIPNEIEVEFERQKIEFSSEFRFRFWYDEEEQFQGFYKDTGRGNKIFYSNFIIYQGESLKSRTCGESTVPFKTNKNSYFTKSEIRDSTEIDDRPTYKSRLILNRETSIEINDNFMLNRFMQNRCSYKDGYYSEFLYYFELNESIDLKPLIENEVELIELEVSKDDLNKFDYSFRYTDLFGYGNFHEDGGNVEGKITIKLVE